jgi:putative tricarboxylic transport membrane protein
MRVRNTKDLWAGGIFLAIGLAFLLLAQDYQLGTARRMGPAYFPVVLSLLLIGIGLATVARALVVEAGPVRDIAGKQLALVTASVVLFGLLVQGAGVAIAIAVLVVFSAAASRNFRPRPTALLAAALALFCVLVFVKGLGMPFRTFGPWFGG